ncbi:hypothetical protein FRC02_002435 [Tulasnella sp. 418]|nr:hypothetical protein FRC02_002435 [Tulasnella sp. 418]
MANYPNNVTDLGVREGNAIHVKRTFSPKLSAYLTRDYQGESSFFSNDNMPEPIWVKHFADIHEVSDWVIVEHESGAYEIRSTQPDPSQTDPAQRTAVDTTD